MEEKTVEYFVNEIQSNRLRFSEVRKILEKGQMDPAEISIFVREVDRKVIQGVQTDSMNTKGKSMIIGGVLLCLVSLFLTIATYIGILGNGNVYVITYGPIAGGISLIMIGSTKLKKK